jgi:hypothetical protein
MTQIIKSRKERANFTLDFSFYIARLISKVFASPLNNQTAPNPLKITRENTSANLFLTSTSIFISLQFRTLSKNSEAKNSKTTMFVHFTWFCKMKKKYHNCLKQTITKQCK